MVEHQGDLPAALGVIRHESALVRGALVGTMLRNDGYNFARLGTFVERADSTARILDVKYYMLLPSAGFVGSAINKVQWETILRSVSAQRVFRWKNSGDVTPMAIAQFLILDLQSPRSLAFCWSKIDDNLHHISGQYDKTRPSNDIATRNRTQLDGHTIDSIVNEGLHEFLGWAMQSTGEVAAAIETDYRFAS
ncbi:MAG: putative alpha-E superfamily protein [Candidatus Poriferisodalaceae bacterium]